MTGSIGPGPVSTGNKGFAGRIAALLLLLGLVAPLADPAGLAAASDNALSPDAGHTARSVVLPGSARVSLRLFGLPGLSDVGQVAPGILRGAQPEPEGYETLRKMGVKTVVNLRTLHAEKKAVAAAGMRWVEIPIDVTQAIDPAAVRQAVAVLTDPANQPVFIHCSRGKDRVGVIVAVYRMEVDGWTEAEAQAEMEAFGFHEIWFHLKDFVRRYPENRRKNGSEAGP